MLAAVVKRTKRTLFDEPYVSFASSSNKSKNKITKKHTVSSSVRSQLWMNMSSNARPLGDHVTMFLGGGFNDFLFQPYLGKIPILTNIFQRG